MKLISLQIDNFGTLKDYRYLFQDGINTIVHENGWGKSTLASFIRVMFYGFDNESKRSELENERKRFDPWQGGGYGGMLVFEAKGKTYRIERNFNEKKGSSFALFDAKTNLKSSDYSDNIGEELFGIDSSSFERTVFIAQQDCATEATSSINAKIGNVAEEADDMGRYTLVEERLKKEADSLTPLRKTGAIAKLKEESAAKEVSIGKKQAVEEQRKEVSGRIKRLSEVREENKKKLRETREEIKKVSLQNDLKRSRDEYERLKDELNKAEEMEKELRNTFPEDLPDGSELEDMSVKTSKLSALSQTMKDFRLDESERRDEERIYDTYSRGFPEEEESSRLLSLWSESNSRKNVLPSKKANLRLMQEMKKKERLDLKRRNSYRIAAVGILTVLAIVFFIFGRMKPDLFIVALGLVVVCVLAALICLIGIKPVRRLKDDTAGELAGSIDEDERFIEKTRETATEFLKRLGDEEAENKDPMVILEKVREDRRRSKEYSKRRAKFDEAHDEREKLVKEINAFVVKYGGESSVNPEGRLQDIRDRLKEYRSSEEKVRVCEKELDDFVREHDIKAFEELASKPEKDPEELDRQLDEIQSEIDREEEVQRSCEDELETLNEILDDIAGDEEDLAVMKERLNELQHRYDIISDTREYLEKAKESFTGKYMEPVKRAFDKYYSVLAGDDGREYELDANLGIRVKNRGVSRDTGLLSGGYRDLVGLCRRMAMIEAMYEEERPFLILDDPFVNLDNDKVKGGMNVLKRISDSYQIIYFTCHDSRAI